MNPNERLLRDYYEAYNSEDESRLLPLLDPQVLLRSAAGEQQGREAYLATYRWMIAQFVDRMTPERIAADADGAEVDIVDRLQARQDIPDFLSMSLSAGQELVLRLRGRYRIRDGRIVGIEIATRE